MLELILRGLFDPVERSNIKWSSTISNIISGRVECIIKIDLMLDWLQRIYL